MNKAALLLDEISGKFFLTGMVLSKIKMIPARLLNPAINILSLLAYLGGYATWYFASIFYPNHCRKRNTWYGFAALREQYQATAFLGMFATILCLICPELILVPLWLYAISNVFWFVGEYHKYNHPPPYDKSYSSERQIASLRYAAMICIAGAITAIASTMAFFFPVIAGTSLLVGTILGNGLSFIALYFWKKCMFDTFQPDSIQQAPETESSYGSISSELSHANSAGCTPPSSDGAYYGSIWQKPSREEVKPEQPEFKEGLLTTQPPGNNQQKHP